MAEQQQQKHYYTVGMTSFNGVCLTQGMAWIESDQHTLSSADAQRLATQQLGFCGTVTSFAPIARAVRRV